MLYSQQPLIYLFGVSEKKIRDLGWAKCKPLVQESQLVRLGLRKAVPLLSGLQKSRRCWSCAPGLLPTIEEERCYSRTTPDTVLRRVVSSGLSPVLSPTTTHSAVLCTDSSYLMPQSCCCCCCCCCLWCEDALVPTPPLESWCSSLVLLLWLLWILDSWNSCWILLLLLLLCCYLWNCLSSCSARKCIARAILSLSF